MRNGNRLSSAADATPALTNAPASLNPAVWRVLSWSDPVASAAPFAVGVAVFVAHSLFDYSLPSIISHVAFLSLFAATALHIANTASGTQLAPQLRVPINAEWVTQAGASLAAGAVKLTQLADRCLAWSDSTLSARALAYTWLIARFSYLASAPYLFFFYILAFLVAPAYAKFQAPVDALIAIQVRPLVSTAAARIRSTVAAVLPSINTNRTTVMGVAAASAVLAAWLFWDSLSLTGVFTFTSLALAAVEGVLALNDWLSRPKAE